MIMDKQLLFSDQQNLAQAAGNYLSTNTVDLGTVGSIVLGGSPIRDIGRGRSLQAVVQVTETFTSGGAGTLQAQLVMADDAALTSNLTVLEETAAIALATLVAGYQFRFGTWPVGTSKEFIGIRYVIGTAAMTAGKVTAGLVFDRQSNPTV